MEVKRYTAEYAKEQNKDYVEVPYGLDITLKNDLVGICYSTWFDNALRDDVKPTIIADEEKTNYKNVVPNRFYYWAEPEPGFYKSSDKAVIRKHMEMLSDAGVDFIILDNTNVRITWYLDYENVWEYFINRPTVAILDTIVEMRSEGKKTPYVVFWNSSFLEDGWFVAEKIYEQYLTQEKWKDCFVYWDGKPFMIATFEQGNIPSYLTVRFMWGLQLPTVSKWSFLYTEKYVAPDENGYAEQVPVCVASQETYMTAPTAHGRNHGIFWYEHWKNAFEHHPKVVSITWWNEWCAQFQGFDIHGKGQFVDAYDREFSRDIEPMKGGHGDQYYIWMCQYIKDYKAGKDCPRLVEEGY